jgi:hypothetical protein
VCETPKVPSFITLDLRKGIIGRGTAAAVSFAAEEGSGNDWKALSARSPSPLLGQPAAMVETRLTDEQNQPLGWSILVGDGELSHARDDRADEVDVKDGVDVDEVENDGYGEEAIEP